MLAGGAFGSRDNAHAAAVKAAAAGVQHPESVRLPMAVRLVGMTIQDDLSLCGSGIGIELFLIGLYSVNFC